jgi:KipI family sensor histidine kinase inhibitor
MLACGDRAILVELADAATRRRLDAALCATPIEGVVEHVPAAFTVLVRVARSRDLPAVAHRLSRLDLPEGVIAEDVAEPALAELVVPTRYDGPDLLEVASHLQVPPAEVVARHTGQVWTVEFTGFSPGFGYLAGAADDLHVPRRQSPRTRVPAGSVALAGPFCGIYPREGPGGWQLVGSTDLATWDVHRDPAALLRPGLRVRFEAVPR